MRQSQAMSVLLSGQSVFLTGPPGAGKTYVLNEFVHRSVMHGKNVAVTASTGIAATHLNGTTIHSWSGLGIRDELSEYDKQWLKANDRLRKRYNATDILVIDEISMLHGKRLDMVNEACKLLREHDAPFGGLQVVLVGDLFQLPPVNRSGELVDFAHLSRAWAELDPRTCYLTEQHRQQGDTLLDILEAMRRGDITEYHEQALQDRIGQRPAADMPVTRLYAHNVDVEAINQRHLSALTADPQSFTMHAKGSKAKLEQLQRSLLAPETLELKLGAEVMFVANNFAQGFVNGSRGQVVKFDDSGLPLVKLLSSGRIIKVEPHTWSLNEDGKVRAEVTQLPLRLAWAITIHKSQGMSLDAADIDLGKAFTPGMGYVALSRVRSLDGVFLTGLNRMALQLHPDIYEFDRQLQRLSTRLAETTADALEETNDTPEAAVPTVVNEALLQRLKTWRLERARHDGVASFMIAHNTTLEELAARQPQTAQALMAVKGLGPQKIAKYGDELLALCADEQPRPPVIAEVTVPAPPPKQPATYPRSSTAWTPEEDARLLEYFRAHTPLSAIAEDLERAPAGIWARLAHLLEPITRY